MSRTVVITWAGIFLFFVLLYILIKPSAGLKQLFVSQVENELKIQSLEPQENLSEKDTAHLPLLVKNYLKTVHALGKQKQQNMYLEVEAQMIQKHIAESPYRVIVCGDFNDPPFAYTYNHISDDLKDSFRESGKGTGKTYHGDIYPSFRIDYILHNSNFNSYGHNIYTDLKISDHYPISCYISLIKK